MTDNHTPPENTGRNPYSQPAHDHETDGHDTYGRDTNRLDEDERSTAGQNVNCEDGLVEPASDDAGSPVSAPSASTPTSHSSPTSTTAATGHTDPDDGTLPANRTGSNGTNESSSTVRINTATADRQASTNAQLTDLNAANSTHQSHPNETNVPAVTRGPVEAALSGTATADRQAPTSAQLSNLNETHSAQQAHPNETNAPADTRGPVEIAPFDAHTRSSPVEIAPSDAHTRSSPVEAAPSGTATADRQAPTSAQLSNLNETHSTHQSHPNETNVPADTRGPVEAAPFDAHTRSSHAEVAPSGTATADCQASTSAQLTDLNAANSTHQSYSNETNVPAVTRGPVEVALSGAHTNTRHAEAAPSDTATDTRDPVEVAPSDAHTNTSTNPTAVNRQDVQRRVLTTVFISQALVGTAIAMGVTVSSWLAKLLLGSDAYAGLPVAAFAVGSTSGAWLLGRATQRYGRRALSTGLTVGGIGAATIVAGGTLHNVPLTFLGMVIYGAAVASGQQLRFAATDLATPTSRGKALSVAMIASTVGALVGPNLVGPVGRIGQTFGVLDLAAPFAAAAMLFAVAAAVITIGFRTDPYLLSCQTPTDSNSADDALNKTAPDRPEPTQQKPTQRKSDKTTTSKTGAAPADNADAGDTPASDDSADHARVGVAQTSTDRTDGAQADDVRVDATLPDDGSCTAHAIDASRSVICAAQDVTTVDVNITSQPTHPANPTSSTSAPDADNSADAAAPVCATNPATCDSSTNAPDADNSPDAANLDEGSNPTTTPDAANPADATNPASCDSSALRTTTAHNQQSASAETQQPTKPTTLAATNWHLVKRAAVATITAQLVMVSVMTMTPIHLQHHNHNLDTVGFVVGLHIFLMYGPSLVTGPLADKVGRNPLAIAGMVVLVAACVVAALSGASVLWGSVALGLLGVGWNLAFVSGSALVVDAVTPHERPTIQSRVEIGASLGGTAGGVGSGFVVAASSYPALCTAAAIISALAAVYFLAPESRRSGTNTAA